MNENNFKNTPVENNDVKIDGNPVADTTAEDYSDLDIFDFDAHRKAKADELKKVENTDLSAKTPIQNPPQHTENTQAKKITDVPANKVVYGASSGIKRKPVVPKVPKDKKEKKIKPIKPITDEGRANVGAVLAKALIYIAVVLLVSCLCAYFIIVVANDVFAFVKDDGTAEVTIPEYATLGEIANELHEKEVIKYPKIFVLYTMIRGNDPGKYLSGTFSVSPSQNYDELLSTFIAKKDYTLTEVSVTIPEGYTVDDIIRLLVEEKGIGTKEGFINAIQNGEYDYWFVEELKDLNPNRKYRLEGYLYPDTYYFYKESDETVIIDKMLKNFHNKFNIQYKQECEKAGMSVDDVVNLASIIQMEAKYSSEYTTVSSVLHNRLNSSYYMRRLDCDSTIQYLLEERVENLTHEHTLIEHPYNTYKNSGLPPGPISNPTLKAIRGALYPEKTSYYFFVSNVKGNMLFAKTYPEHEANIATVRAESEALKKEQ
ncbi:MAG: endolytic transglycosylase MltG [Ruminococcaceae bacterium]|nr:endolytic transglycosylase MltG [Oscillospiraceae bacterium]